MIRLWICILALALSGFFQPECARGDAQPVPAWRSADMDGVQWLIDPNGKPFYSKGVNIVNPAKETEKSRAGQAYCWLNFFPTMEEWQEHVGEQLRQWGFNTLGGWSDPSPNIGLALTVDLELGRNSRFHFFDPFDPKMEESTVECARELTAPYRDQRYLVGYYIDNEVGWWNSPLFIWYLKDKWENHTKQFLCKTIYDYYGGSWEKLLADWVPQKGIDGFEGLKQTGAALKLRPEGNGIRLVDLFMKAVAKRYYELMSRAIRIAHPGALVIGDRLPLYYHQDAILAMGDNVDVIATNYNVTVPDGWVAPYFFDGLRKLSRKPVLVTEYFFAAAENRSGNRNETARNIHTKPGHLMTVDTQIQRTWGAGNALLNFARFPNVVGAHWFQYCDEPLGGREDGEDYNMGLIDTANKPYEELTENFARLNPVLEAVHRGSGVEPEWKTMRGGDEKSGAVPIPRAERAIDVNDQSLMEWEKEKTLLSGFNVPAPHVPFGDVHMAWRPEGLYLFSLSDTFVHPDFLEYKGTFPYSESFQLHFTVEAEGKLNHIAAYLVPRNNPQFPDGFEVTPDLFRMEGGRDAEQLPAKGHIQKLNKALPHMSVEAFFPAEWFGMKELKPGMHLRVNIGLASYFREFTMAWAGKAEMEQIKDPQEFREIVLE